MNTGKPLLERLTTRPQILSSLKSVRKVAIRAWDTDSIYIGQKVLETYQDVETLAVDIHPYAVNFDILKLRTQQNQVEPVAGTLFSHMLPFESCSPLRLTSLSLSNLDMKQAATTYLKVIDFSQLVSLTWDSCTGLLECMQAMAEAFVATTKYAKLSSLKIQHSEEDNGEIMDGLDKFLSVLTSKINKFSFFITGAGRCPNTTGITRHASSLESLVVLVIDVDGDQITYSAEDFNRICLDCVKLKQIFVSFPGVHLEADGVMDMFDRPYWAFLASAWRLQYLVALNISSWPTIAMEMTLECFDCQLQSLAQRIFENNEKYISSLAVLSIGNNVTDDPSGPDGMLEGSTRNYYLRGKQTNVFGQTSVLAIPMKARLVKYAYPGTETLCSDY